MALTEVGNLNANVAHDLSLNATAVQISNATLLYAMEIDNTGNTLATYVKLWENGAPTVGTTPPEEVWRVPGGVKMTVTFSGGHQFTTDIYVAGLTTGGTAGSTAPTNNVPAKFWTD